MFQFLDFCKNDKNKIIKWVETCIQEKNPKIKDDCPYESLNYLYEIL